MPFQIYSCQLTRVNTSQLTVTYTKEKWAIPQTRQTGPEGQTHHIMEI